jgi:L-asparaginase
MGPAFASFVGATSAEPEVTTLCGIVPGPGGVCAALMPELPEIKLRVIATGGTIDKVYFDAKSDYQIGEPQAGAILHEAGVTFDFTVESVLRKDSLALTDADRALVRERVLAAPERHILITHGTDTMTATAAVLADVRDKVIVFTGSMLPARFRQNDALFNLGLRHRRPAGPTPGRLYRHERPSLPRRCG